MNRITWLFVRFVQIFKAFLHLEGDPHSNQLFCYQLTELSELKRLKSLKLVIII